MLDTCKRIHKEMLTASKKTGKPPSFKNVVDDKEFDKLTAQFAALRDGVYGELHGAFAAWNELFIALVRAQ